jgi:hypothetical protein
VEQSQDSYETMTPGARWVHDKKEKVKLIHYLFILEKIVQYDSGERWTSFLFLFKFG